MSSDHIQTNPPPLNPPQQVILTPSPPHVMLKNFENLSKNRKEIFNLFHPLFVYLLLAYSFNVVTIEREYKNSVHR